jgi:phosphatidylglycerol:prolipoprotein diacylglycerol transferase
VHPILFRLPLPHFGTVPIYSYGIMLAVSLIVGWFLTLGLAERDGLPKEAMANCYVDTAVMALLGSRLLYVVTNPGDFTSLASLFAMRSGGLVAYGGFLGGFVGSYLSLRFGVGLTGLVRFVAGRFAPEERRPWSPLPLLPWADVAVPSLASGLCITRIGCYLFGCDFGRPLGEGAPAVLKTLGTFPRWPDGTMTDGSLGSPAWDHHVRTHLLGPEATASLPVHPTQLYESLLGLSLLVFLLVMRRHQRFRGEIFLWFTFLYGTARFLLELVRDDAERGNIPPAASPHVLLPLSLALLGVGYAVGIAGRVKPIALRVTTQVGALVPAVWSFVATQPKEFETIAPIELSTSQAVGLASGVLACAGFWVLWHAAVEHPELAMQLPDFSAHLEAEPDAEDDGEETRGDRAPEGNERQPKAKKRKPTPEPSSANAEAGDATLADDEAIEPRTEAREGAPRERAPIPPSDEDSKVDDEARVREPDADADVKSPADESDAPAPRAPGSGSLKKKSKKKRK